MSVLFKAEGSAQHETLMLPTQQETTRVFLSSAGHLFAAGDMCCCALSLIWAESKALRSEQLMTRQSMPVPRAGE